MSRLVTSTKRRSETSPKALPPLDAPAPTLPPEVYFCIMFIFLNFIELMPIWFD